MPAKYYFHISRNSVIYKESKLRLHLAKEHKMNTVQRKVHISLYVENLETSKKFYSLMFSHAPTMEKDDYIQWKLDSPSVNFVIEPVNAKNRCCDKKAGLSHLGVEVETDEALKGVHYKIKNAGFKTSKLDDSHCCYARSKKSWFIDPSNIRWENFKTTERDHQFGHMDDKVLIEMEKNHVA